MVQRRELKIKVEETDCAVSGFGGAAALIRVAQQSGLMEEMEESLKGMKKRRRGNRVSEMAMDVMLLMCVGGECIDDMRVLRADKGLRRLLGRCVMAPSTTRDFLWGVSERGRQGLGRVRRFLLSKVAEARREWRHWRRWIWMHHYLFRECKRLRRATREIEGGCR